MEQPIITWLGQSFVSIQTQSQTIFIDPWKHFPPGNNAFPKDYILPEPDLILVTHGHLDHLGDTVDMAKNAKKPIKIISNFEIMLYLMSQGISGEYLQGMGIGGTVTIASTMITMVQAVHSSGIGPFAPQPCIEGGTASGYVLTLANRLTLYHAGDTDVFGDMELIRTLHKPHWAFMPIGGVYTMGPREAAYATKKIQPNVVIPIHFGGTFCLPGKPDEFALALQEHCHPAPELIVPIAGVPLSASYDHTISH